MRSSRPTSPTPIVMRDGAIAAGAGRGQRLPLAHALGCVLRRADSGHQLPARSHRGARSRFDFDADFADVFEVRGTRRARRGERLPDVGARRVRACGIAVSTIVSGAPRCGGAGSPDRAARTGRCGIRCSTRADGDGDPSMLIVELREWTGASQHRSDARSRSINVLAMKKASRTRSPTRSAATWQARARSSIGGSIGRLPTCRS